MRKPLIAGNWKMYKTRREARDVVNALLPLVANNKPVEIAICPPATALNDLADLVKGTNVALGAQNCHWEDEGAFTGELSPRMLKDAGCKYVIVGHSERRQFFGETDANINKKARALYRNQIIPIICVGETLAEREASRTAEVVTTQLKGCLAGLPAERFAESVIAYEPVWAIGTGKTATPEQAQEVHALIRKLIAEIFGPNVAEQVRIQYGGSVKPENATTLMTQPDIDGALVGGASLKADSFAAIVNFNT